MDWIKKFSKLQLLGAGEIIFGLILIIFARVGMEKAAAAKSFADHVTGFFTNNTGMWDPLIQFFGGKVNQEASKYDTMLTLLLWIGLILLVHGVYMFVRHRRVRSK